MRNLKNREIPPDPNELEISVFGPGYGESIVVHLGMGEWLVIDSCLSDDRDKPIALDYFERLGINYENDVKVIMASHWHDDHIRGLSALYAECINSKFACSNALLNKEFFELLAAGKKNLLVASNSGSSEFSGILSDIRARKKRTHWQNASPDIWLMDGTIVFNSNNLAKQAVVTALSPSSQTITDSTVRFAKMLPTENQDITKLPTVEPNDTSVVVSIQSKYFTAILGADLEVSNDTLKGWDAVLNSQYRPKKKSLFFKIAHHGSHTGDHADVWQHMLEKNPYAFLTPFARQKNKIPLKSDLTRISKRTPNFYLTRWPPTQRLPKRPNPVERSIKSFSQNHTAIQKRVGHLRFRIKMDQNSQPNIEMFNGAHLFENV